MKVKPINQQIISIGDKYYQAENLGLLNFHRHNTSLVELVGHIPVFNISVNLSDIMRLTSANFRVKKA